MFTEAEKEEDYAREIAKDVSFSGNEELFKSFYSGTKVKYWYEPFGRVGGAGLVTFFEIPNKQLALDYVRAMVDKENAQVRFKYQPVTVAENDSWFMSEEDARNNAEYSFGKELVSQFPDLIINRGFVVTDKWLIIGEKRLIEPYLEEFGNQTNNLNDEVSRIFSGSNMVLDREAPVWLRLDFGINRLDEVAMCRVNYFSSKMPLRDARKKVYVDRQKLPDLAPFEVESENDRSYLLFERILIGIVGRYQSNITSFSKSSDCLFWKYHTFLK